MKLVFPVPGMAAPKEQKNKALHKYAGPLILLLLIY
jgi:hypothetical protein